MNFDSVFNLLCRRILKEHGDVRITSTGTGRVIYVTIARENFEPIVLGVREETGKLIGDVCEEDSGKVILPDREIRTEEDLEPLIFAIHDQTVLQPS
jgi:hypothetical protein